MKIKSGIKLLEEREGSGPPAENGDSVRYSVRGFLSRGDEIAINEISEDGRKKMLAAQPDAILEKDGAELINFACRIGGRDAIAGVEYSLIGMKAGGFRKVKVSPHLAYREGGAHSKVPPDAVITFHIWLNTIAKYQPVEPNNDQVFLFRPGEERRRLARMQFGLHRDGNCSALFTYPIPGFPWRHNAIQTGAWQIEPDLARAIFLEIEDLPLSHPDICLADDHLYSDHAEKANAITRDRDTHALCYAIGIIQSRGEFRLRYSVRETEEAFQCSTLLRTVKDLTAALENHKPWECPQPRAKQATPETAPSAPPDEP